MSKKDCLSNHEESCSWLDADAALAKRFGTRCLKESFVRNDEATISANVVHDECSPVAVDFAAFDIGAKEHSIIETFKPAMIGYRAYVQIGGLLSIVAVLVICLHAMYCQKKEVYDGYQLIEDKVEEV